MVLVVKNLPANAGDMEDVGWIPGLGRSPGGGHGYSLQYSCLENPRDTGTWWVIVYRFVKSWTWLKRLSMHACMEEVSQGGQLASWMPEHVSCRGLCSMRGSLLIPGVLEVERSRRVLSWELEGAQPSLSVNKWEKKDSTQHQVAEPTRPECAHESPV